MAELERVYTIPLGEAYDYSRVKRARRAVKMVRSFLSRHMKAEASNVRISEATNELIWGRGMQKPPRKIKVRAVKDGARVLAYLMDEKVGEEKKAEKKPEKKEEPAKGKPAEAKAAPKPEEAKAEKPKEEKKPEKAPAAKAPEKPKEEEKKAEK